MTSIDLERIKQQKSISELIEFSILNIDKPSGPTSFLVSDFIRKNLGIRKTSHAGTLDPKVTGVLPVMLNRACKLSEWFMKKNKTYVGVMRLHGDVDDEKLKKEIEGFVGKIKQLPPVKSRVKREEREREVYSFEILERGEKDRKNVLLLGDSLEDVDMVKGYDYEGLIKVGFLNEKVDENLEKYKNHYDILIFYDGDMEFVNKMLSEVFKKR